MIYDELPSSWRFVDDEKKLSKNKGCAECHDELPIVITSDLVLPSFIWKTSGTFFNPLTFTLTEVGTSNVINLTSEIQFMQVFIINGVTYVSSNVLNYTANSTPLLSGVYEAKIWDGITYIYSEPIKICSDITHCVQITWSNTCDLAGIPYAYLESLYGTPFLNSMFVVDMTLFSPEYETEKAKYENMLRQVDVFYLNQTRTFSVTHPFVPEWFVRAIQVMQLHDLRTVIYDTDANHPNGLYTSIIKDCEVSSNANELGGHEICNSTMTIKFRQDDAVVSTYCCVNSEPEPCINPCFTVDGFRPDADPPIPGHYYIHDFDSPVIDIYTTDKYETASDMCMYVYNSATGTYMYYDGDQWKSTPDIYTMNVVLVQGNLVTVEITGYTMPGTWVNIGFSSFEGGCDYGISYPVSAAQLAAGWQIVINSDTYYFLCIRSLNHSCQYDIRQIHFDL